MTAATRIEREAINGFREGDQALAKREVRLESGGYLRAGQRVVVDILIAHNPLVGIKWHDEDGTHAMAYPADDLESVANA